LNDFRYSAIGLVSREFNYWMCFGMERFVARVLQNGKITIPKRIRELQKVNAGDYVRLDLLEVIHKKS